MGYFLGLSSIGGSKLPFHVTAKNLKKHHILGDKTKQKNNKKKEDGFDKIKSFQQ